MDVVYYRSTEYIKATATDVNGDPATGGTATISLATLDGTAVTGVTWPASMTEDGVTGVYVYTLPYNLLDKDVKYRATIDIVVGALRHRTVYTFRCGEDTD